MIDSIIKPAQGKILIAEPFQRDFYFYRSIVLLAEHNKDGTFGLVLNKPVNIKFNEILKDFPNFKAPIYLGGPVQTDNIYFIHTLGNQVENSMEIIKGIYWGGDIEVVKSLMVKGKITPNQIRFFIGYSGWVPNQLDDELKEKSWIISEYPASFLLKQNPDSLWKNSLISLKNEYSEWANYPLDPSMN